MELRNNPAWRQIAPGKNHLRRESAFLLGESIGQGAFRPYAFAPTMLKTFTGRLSPFN
jgi:hypothetical protein